MIYAPPKFTTFATGVTSFPNPSIIVSVGFTNLPSEIIDTGITPFDGLG